MNNDVLFRTLNGVNFSSPSLYKSNEPQFRTLNGVNFSSPSLYKSNEPQKRRGVLDLSAWEKNACPLCGHLSWAKIRRTWLEKVLHPSKNKCVCRGCKREFWREAVG